ncbi:hypothetical protein M9Y10_041001 [Tritrichomonas musculus]|uniref:V-type proton ATPase subunit C n=1 Tax=Tritrichomonas musculus TaxID=1915356 RepID=A0ABR2K363_9EUKA
MTQYLLISLKNGNKTVNQLIGNLGKVTNFKVDQHLAPFESQDQLVKIADDLSHLDTTTLSMLTRFSRSIQDIYKKIDIDNKRDWSSYAPGIQYTPVEKHNIEVIVDTNGDQQIVYSLPEYMKNFQWDERLIGNKKDIETVKNSLQEAIDRDEENIRTLTNDYSDAGNSLNNIIRGNEGTLATKNLDEIAAKAFKDSYVTNKAEFGAIITKDAGSNSIKFCVDTKNLKTVFVVIKKSEKKSFETDYRLQTNYVVPVPPQLIEEDGDFYLYTVTLLRDNIEDYKTACKDRRWNVRDFQFNPKLIEENQKKNLQLIIEYRNLQDHYSTFLHDSFSQLFIYWMHVKALRVFVESRLLYGINTQFNAYLIEATTKNIAKIHKSLQTEYDDGMEADDKGDDDNNDLNAEDADLVYSYFSSKINIVGLTPALK